MGDVDSDGRVLLRRERSNVAFGKVLRTFVLPDRLSANGNFRSHVLRIV